MRKKDIVLAVAVLSVLACLLAAGYAQGRDDNPDAFALRRQLLDQIEAAYTADDTAMLERMADVPSGLTPERAAAQLRYIADEVDALRELELVNNPEAAEQIEKDGLAVVESEFGSPWNLFNLLDYLCAYNRDQRLAACGLEFDLCINNGWSPPSHCNNSPTPSRDCVPYNGFGNCGGMRNACELDVYQNPGFGCT